MDSQILPVFNHFALNDFNSKADRVVKQVFHWLPKLTTCSNTYCILNCVWPLKNNRFIKDFPQHYDRYIISFNLEYPDFDWIKEFCRHFSDRQVICIVQFDNLHFELDNLTWITYDVWPEIIKILKQKNLIPEKALEQKQYKISSLSSRVDQFKAYVSAHLVKNYTSQDYILSWLGKVSGPGDLFWLDNTTGNDQIDTLVEWIKQTNFVSTVRSLDNFENNPLLNTLNFNHDAYTKSVVNCTNESWMSSYRKEYIFPGPYLTDKTFKSLLGGTAMLAVGQYNIHNYLRTLGFEFDYPWSLSYDDDPGDITRITKILTTIDEIMQMDIHYLDKSTKESCEYNRQHLINDGYYKIATEQNCINLGRHIAI